MSYTVSERDIMTIRRAARIICGEATALFECSTFEGDWGDDAAAEKDYLTMVTLQELLDDLADRMMA